MSEANKDTNLINPPKTTRMVKIKAQQDIRLLSTNEIVKAGQVVSATEEDAAEFCDQVLEGQYGHSGERYKADGDCSVRKIVRAKRV